MRQNVWILNHYATNMFFDGAGRHYWFAENLQKQGYIPTVFCASTNHFSDNNIDTQGEFYYKDTINEIPFIFLNVPEYKGNGLKRITNMIAFYNALLKLSSNNVIQIEKPDIILASSVHPLTLVAGIKLAKKFGVPCICEVRDLWPESIVAYGALKRDSLFAKLLYSGEKWIYEKADTVIMTWEGGKSYIEEHNWEKTVDINKIKHISNGVNIESFDNNSNENIILDQELDDKSYKNLVYAGSIRKVNNLGLLLDAALILKEKDEKIRILIYGSGDEKDMLEQRCKLECIDNVIFKGRVEKKMVPSILKKAHANILHNSSTSLDKYGQSQNKFFEYLAAGRCVIQTYSTGYSVLSKYNCGVSATEQNAKEIAKAILEVCSDSCNVEQKGKNARVASYQFDFEILTHNLIQIIESI